MTLAAIQDAPATVRFAFTSKGQEASPFGSIPFSAPHPPSPDPWAHGASRYLAWEPTGYFDRFFACEEVELRLALQRAGQADFSHSADPIAALWCIEMEAKLNSSVGSYDSV